MDSAPQLPPLSPLASPLSHSFANIMVADFEKQSYWHDRFVSEETFEWLLPSEKFISIVEPVLSRLRPDARILHVGFGTSDLQNHFRARGLTNVLNLDYEPLAIARGREQETKAFGDVKMRYDIQDATQLRLSSAEKFDLVVDKSTADAVSCAGDAPLRRMAAGVRSCLSPDGIWVSLSYSAWRFDLENLPFTVEVLSKVLTPKLKPTDPDIFYYCYLLRPKRDAAAAS